MVFWAQLASMPHQCLRKTYGVPGAGLGRFAAACSFNLPRKHVRLVVWTPFYSQRVKSLQKGQWSNPDLLDPKSRLSPPQLGIYSESGREAFFFAEVCLGATAGTRVVRRGFLEEVILNEERRCFSFSLLL